MKKFICSAILGFTLLAGFQAKAQDIFYSRDQKFTLKDADYSVVGWSGDRLYTYRASKEGYFLDAYNDSMRLLATIALDFFPKKIIGTQFYATDDAIIALYQAEQDNQIVQYAVKLDSKGRMQQNKPLAIDSVKLGWFATGRQFYASVASSDKSKIMIYSISGRKSKHQNVSTVLLDPSLNIIARSNHDIESESDLVLNQVLLSNDGTLYLAGHPEDNNRKYFEDSWVFSLSPNDQQFRKVALPLSDNYVTETFMRLNDINNDVYVGAYYSNKKSGDLQGVAYGVLPAAAASFSTFKQLPFDDALRNASDERNKKKAFNDYEVRKIIVKNDGGFIIVGEDYTITTRSYGGGGYGFYSPYSSPYGNRLVRIYHYGDVMVLDYDSDGNKKWQSFVRKEQNSQDDGGMFSSYSMLNTGGSLVFLYNDNASGKSPLSVAAIDVDGNLQMKRMNTGSRGNADWIPRLGKQTDSRELLIPLFKKDNIGFARVAF